MESFAVESPLWGDSYGNKTVGNLYRSNNIGWFFDVLAVDRSTSLDLLHMLISSAIISGRTDSWLRLFLWIQNWIHKIHNGQ